MPSRLNESPGRPGIHDIQPSKGRRPNLTWVWAALEALPAGAAPRRYSLLPRKEVIQPQVPLRLPCYDFTPVTDHTVVSALPKVRQLTSGATSFHGVTGGVYKARERIHRDMLIRDY